MAQVRGQQFTASALEAGTIDRLLALPTAGHAVLSVYVSLDPSSLPNLVERREQANALLDEAHRRGEELGLGHDERIGLREDIERVRELLADDEELSPPAAHGLAILCSATAGVAEVVRLPRAVSPVAIVDERPFLEPLLDQPGGERWCVLLVSRRATRMFLGDSRQLLEVDGTQDDVHRQHAQGGWSQARYQRGVEKEADDHIRASCAMAFERLRRRPFDRLLLGGPEELHPRVQEHMNPQLRELLAGCFEIDVERATREDVRQRATPLIEAAASERERDALGRLREGMAPDGGGATGPADVLELLNERRVATLLLAAGSVLAGWRCPKCGRLAASAGDCQLDGTPLEGLEDATPAAIALAREQSAEVLLVHEPGALSEQDGIAALVRY